MNTRVILRLIGTTLLLTGMTGLLAGLGGPDGAAAEETRTPVHTDGKAMQKNLLEALTALMRHDAVAARRAMDGLEKHCRRMGPSDADLFGREILSVDRAYHKAMDRTREHAGAGEVDAAFDAFFWVQRSCRECHAVARETGRLPAQGPLW